MNSYSNISYFKKCLSNRNLLEKFEYNLRKNIYHNDEDFPYSSLSIFLFVENPKCYISSAFKWNYTREGELFWANISWEWRKCLRNNML